MTGELLGLADTVETGAVVLVLDLRAENLPWLAPPTPPANGSAISYGSANGRSGGATGP